MNTFHGLLLLTFLTVVTATPSFADPQRPAQTIDKLAGDWNGSLTLPTTSLPLVFHFANSGSGYSLTIDSPAQGSFGIVGDKVTFDGTQIDADIPVVHGSFSGKLSADGATIVGTWNQGSPLPLTLTHAAPAAPSDPIPANAAGNWSGTLPVNGSIIHLYFHFTTVDGSVRAFADCPEQKLFEVGGAALVNHGGVISAPFPSLGGTLSGTIDADGTQFNGTWTQNATVPIVLTHSLPTPAAALPDGLVGTWAGPLAIPSGNITIVLAFTKDADGAYATTFASPDQTGAVYPGTVISLPDNVIEATYSKVGISFKGKLSEDGSSLYGLCAQGNHNLALDLTKTTKPVVAADRPQNPKPPYSYMVKNVTFPSSAPGVTIAGTLTIPKNAKKVPAVVLIAGSGGQDRDENIFGHKIFAVIADYLTRRGFAVLRYDKRGVGESTGVYADSTIADFADDAQSAANYLATVRGVDTAKIGLIGHSEGGAIAPIVSARDPKIRYIVLLAGPGVSGLDIILRQQILIAEGEGAAKDDIEKNQEYQQIAMSTALMSDGSEADRAKLVATYQKIYAGTASPDQLAANVAPQIQTIFMPWYRSFLALDPKKSLSKLTIPVLALNGSNDRQVDPKQNLPAIEAALTIKDKGNFKIVEIPGLNHMFQDSKTGAFSEYAKIPETFSPKALEILGSWLETVTKR